MSFTKNLALSASLLCLTSASFADSFKDGGYFRISASAPTREQQVKTNLTQSTQGSVAEVATGAGLLFTGVGTIPGAVLLVKGVVDLSTDLYNIWNFSKYNDEPNAYSAIGSTSVAVARQFGSSKTDLKEVGRQADAADAVVSMGMGIGATVLPLRAAMTGRLAKNLSDTQRLVGGIVTMSGVPTAAQKIEGDYRTGSAAPAF